MTHGDDEVGKMYLVMKADGTKSLNLLSISLLSDFTLSKSKQDSAEFGCSMMLPSNRK